MANSRSFISEEIKRQHLWRGLSAILSTMLLLFLGVGHVSAHAIILKTEPQDMAVLSQSPHRVRIWFSESVVTDLTQIKVVNSNGVMIPVTFSAENQTISTSPVQEVILDVNLPDLPPGVYSITYRTVSSDDLHATSGSLVFGIQTTPLNSSPETKAVYPSAVEVVFQWVNFAGFAGLLGTIVLAYLIRRKKQDFLNGLNSGIIEQLEQKNVSMVAWFAGAAVVGEVGLLMVQRQSLFNGVSFSVLDSWKQILLQTSYGGYWLTREVLLLLMIAIAIFQMNHRSANKRFSNANLFNIIGLTSIGLAVLATLSSHITTVFGYSWVRLATGTIHLLGAGTWVGGLLVLSITTLPFFRQGPAERAAAQSILRGFGGAAVVSVLVLFVTGLYLSGQMVASLDALILSFYGRTLILKGLLVISTGLAGLLNSASIHEQVAGPIRRILHKPVHWVPFTARGLRYSILSEASIAGCVLLAAALMGASQPARGPAFDPPSPSEAQISSELSAHVSDLIMTLSVKPDRPGENFVTLGIFNSRRPSPAPIDQVLVRFTSPDTTRGDLTTIADALGDGEYQVTGGIFDTPGNWKISISVKRRGLQDSNLTVPWTVLPPFQAGPSHPVILSNQPLAPWLNISASVIALLSLLFLVWLRIHRWMGNHTVDPAASPIQKG